MAATSLGRPNLWERKTQGSTYKTASSATSEREGE